MSNPRLAQQQEKAKREYEAKVEAIMVHTQGRARHIPDQELKKLQEEVDQTHQKWFNSRQLQLVHEKALEGRNQKIRKLQSIKEKVSTYMDRLIHERQEDDWYTDKYWGLIPVKVRQAEQRCQEYERMLAELLTTDTAKQEEHKIHIQTCILCEEIILGKGNKKESMALHMYHTHWTEL